jgi:hypothetical protein
MNSVRRYLPLVPLIGAIGFLLLYFYSAALYPGGTKFDPSTLSYSHFNNFWCDLLDPITYAQRPNDSRPSALAGTILLSLSLIPFWYFLPVLFRKHERRNRAIQVLGCSSMILAAFVFTSAHDWLITLAGVLGLTAFGISTFELFRNGHRGLASIASFAFVFALMNAVMWEAGLFLRQLPVVQKAAFATFLTWVIFTSLQCWKKKGRRHHAFAPSTEDIH